MFAIKRFPDPILKQPTQPVGRVDGRIVKFVDRLITTMRSHPKCVGLAAPQVGSNLRIAVMDASCNPKASVNHGLLVLINPEIEEREGNVIQREGCLSIPDFTGNVRRASKIRIKAFDRFGSLEKFTMEGFEAIVAQHELDHLDGKLFLDRVANLKTDIFRRKTYL